MSKQNITHMPHPYLWRPTDRYTPFYSLFRDKLSLPRELVFKEFQEQESNGNLQYLLEVYVHDFMLLIISATKEEMLHVATVVMTGIHNVFPVAADDINDLISCKKMKKGESQLSMRKTLLGFDFDSDKKSLWLEQEK
jgi:hypothetical protein